MEVVTRIPPPMLPVDALLRTFTLNPAMIWIPAAWFGLAWETRPVITFCAGVAAV